MKTQTNLTFNMILRGFGIEPYDVRLARHLDTSKKAKRSPYSLWRTNRSEFERYQQMQIHGKFKIGNTLASFVITPSGQTLFAGIFHVDDMGEVPEGTICPVQDLPVEGCVNYSISRDARLSDLIGRVVIGWGPAARAWVQLANRQDKPIIEIRRSVQDEFFPGLFNFRCRLSEVLSLPPSWVERLQEARGVYVLSSLATGLNYVGSAGGLHGFYGRWCQHAAAGGDAMAFQHQLSSDYQISILHVSAGFETENDLLKIEQIWMQKLLSRSMGLNGSPVSLLPLPQN